jgi:hypothetical protein
VVIAGCALIIAAFLCWTGVVYQTGANWYSTCWQKAHQNRQPASPEEAASWATCSAASDEAFFEAGFIYAGNPQYAVSPQLKAIQAACPNAWNEIPLDGPYPVIVEMIQNKGGPSLADRLLPARFVIEGAFRSKWPNCPTARVVNGFPRMTKEGNGWAWERPCVPCEPEQKAIQKDDEERAAWQRKWASMTEAERDASVDKSLDDALKERAAEKSNPSESVAK